MTTEVLPLILYTSGITKSTLRYGCLPRYSFALYVGCLASSLTVWFRSKNSKNEPHKLSKIDPKTGTVHVSRDVVAQENNFWPWEENKENEVVFPESFTVVSNVLDGGDNAETEDVPKTPEQLVATCTPGSFAETFDVASENSSEPR